MHIDKRNNCVDGNTCTYNDKQWHYKEIKNKTLNITLLLVSTPWVGKDLKSSSAVPLLKVVSHDSCKHKN
jgi:hypothetical protein